MAKLLEKLFTWQYFEPVLFTSIGVLLLLLFIVLFLGKKDQKRKLEETKKLELSSLTKDNSVDAFAKEETPSEAVEVTEQKEVVEPAVEDNKDVIETPPMNMETTIEENPLPDFEVFGSNEETEPIASSTPFDEINAQDNSSLEQSLSYEQSSLMPEIPEITPEEVTVPDVTNNIDSNILVSEETQEPDLPSFDSTVYAESNDMNDALNIPIEEPVKEEIPVVDEVVKSSVIPEDVAQKEIELTEEKIQDFKNNFADLASSISKELDEINRLQEEVKIKKDNPIPNDLPMPDEVEVVPIKEAAKFTPSDVFSSVYSPKESKIEMPSVKEDIPKPVIEEHNPLKMEMPIKKEEIELPKISKEPVNIPDFSSFDNETFDIK